MSKFCSIIKLFFVIIISCLYVSLCDAVEIVKNGKTSLIVYHGKEAPSSVLSAAKELKYYLKQVSDVDIKITTKLPAGNYISLGYNELSRRAGLKLNKIKSDGYAIIAKNANIYIFGHDTKDGAVSTKCGFSKGTLFGVYTFIEKYLGVRWFMPGKDGEFYLPKIKHCSKRQCFN